MKTQLLTTRETAIAATLIRRGQLVGIPTETVYGLGADGLNPAAVTNIFEAKGRPQDNPLILHIAQPNWMDRYCTDIPRGAYELAEAFWPGPLTIILKRQTIVPDVVTAGLSTVGVRCPAHPVCREIIQVAGTPVAAPSGNTSGRPSPTTAQHMLEDMEGKIPAVLDGGSCTVGVESTIIDMTATPPRLLRPGGITLEQLQAVLGEVAVDEAILRPMGEGERPRAPGMKYRHYAPKAPVTVVTGDGEKTAEYIAKNAEKTHGIICFDQWKSTFSGFVVETLGRSDDLEEQGRRVFDALRSFDSSDVTAIWAQCPSGDGLGLAIANRLSKAAGFHIVEVE